MSDRDLIDFADLAKALLDRAVLLVPSWLPGGKVVGHEYVCADLCGGEGGSCSVNLVTGKWGDFSGEESGGDLISLYAAINNLNQGQAARALQAEMGWQRSSVQASVSRPHRSLPERFAEAGLEPPDQPEPPPAERDGDGNGAGGRRKSMWRAIVPVPPHAPPADFKHWHYTDVAGSWEYAFEGKLYGHVVRFATSDGGKEILPHTWCVDESDGRGTMRWHWKQWELPRPLYVPSTLLSGDPSTIPVVLVEGEKCALAGHRLLGHEFDFVSWPGGSNAWSKAAWDWLKGRTVYLWPDADAKRQRLTPDERKTGVDPGSKPLLPEPKQPGMKAMVAIGSLLMADQACTVLMCPVPAPDKTATDGWDIADAIEGGWGPDDVRGFIRGARTFVPPSEGARARSGNGAATPSSAGASGESAVDADGVDRRWRGKFLETVQGAIKPVRENAVLALDGLRNVPDQPDLPGAPDLQGLIAFNEFSNDVIKMRDAPWGTPAGMWHEVDELHMGEWLTRVHWLPSMPRGTLEEAVKVVADRHRFHPVMTYLQGLTWDKTPRLSTWLRRACLEEDEWDNADPLQQYLARVGTFFLMGMCARVMTPGVKFDYMLILEGAQGIRKSTLLRVLAGDWFADTGLVLGDKDSYQQLQGRWLYEFGELDSFSKAEVSKIKLFIASASDYFRASFDRRARDYPRQVVFGGTTNEDHYLTDPTGNRRFWPVRVTRLIDIDWVMEMRDQLFAEAMVRLAAGKRMHPTPDEEADLFKPQQERRTVENAIESAITSYLYADDGSEGDLCNSVTLVKLLGKIGIGIEKLGPGRFHEKQAAAALRKLGWIEEGRESPGSSNGKRGRLYRRPIAGNGDGSADGASGSRSSSKRSTQSDNTAGADSDCPF